MLTLRSGFSGKALCVAAVLALQVVLAGCSKIKGEIDASLHPRPRSGEEPALLLLYIDDSASMDPDRMRYGEYAIRILRGIGVEEPSKVGVRFSTFRSDVIPQADLTMANKSTLEKAAIDYQDSQPQLAPGEKRQGHDPRDKGTSLKNVLIDAEKTIRDSKAGSVMVAIICDGGVEDGPNGDLPGALAAAKKLESPPGHVKNLKVVMVGISDKANGSLVRAQEAFWAKTKVKYQLGKEADSDALISSASSDFAALVK